jgi:hypothetical protein
LIPKKSVTALFTLAYSGVEIRHFDFGRPVLDFVVGVDGVIVASLDGQWTCDDPDAIVLSENSLMARTVKLSSAGEVCLLLIRIHFLLFKLFQLIETFETYNSLIESLNFKGLLPGMSALIINRYF